MEPERDRPSIAVEAMPTMEWELEELVAEGELRYVPRNSDRLDELPKVYDVADDVPDDRRVELIATLRRYDSRRRQRDSRD